MVSGGRDILRHVPSVLGDKARGSGQRPVRRLPETMPELPEVETVVRGLKPVMEGATIDRVTLARPDLRFPFPENLKTG